MHESLHTIAKSMKQLGLSSLAHAQHLLTAPYLDSEFTYYNRDLAVLQASHAAEILAKAHIAEHHPLLIFSQIPKPTQTDSETLDLKALFETGKTIQYHEIPDRLWATTGYKIKQLQLYQDFGKLRNSIQHFTSVRAETFLAYKTLEFIYGIIDPMIHELWGIYAVNCIEEGLYSSEQKDFFRYLHFWEISFLMPEGFEEINRKAKQSVKNQTTPLGQSFLKDENW